MTLFIRYRDNFIKTSYEKCLRKVYKYHLNENTKLPECDKKESCQLCSRCCNGYRNRGRHCDVTYSRYLYGTAVLCLKSSGYEPSNNIMNIDRK